MFYGYFSLTETTLDKHFELRVNIGCLVNPKKTCTEIFNLLREA